MHFPVNPDSNFFSLPIWQRHLTWSLAGPALLDCDWSPASLPILADAIDTNTNSLITRVAALPQPKPANSARLGLVFEHLLQHWFEQTVDRVQSNLQIRSSNRTLGELDLLVESGGEHWHLELAIKYYIGHQEGWIGPNRRDRLADKIRHTREHQLHLSAQSEVVEQLKRLGWSPTHRASLMRGCLFHPAHKAPTAQLPEDVSSAHWSGHWTYSSRCHLLPEGDWHLLSKDEWLSPCLVTNPIGYSGLKEYLETQFRYLQIPVCLARVEEGQYGWAEQERWFLMPEQWPFNA